MASLKAYRLKFELLKAKDKNYVNVYFACVFSVVSAQNFLNVNFEKNKTINET